MMPWTYLGMRVYCLELPMVAFAPLTARVTKNANPWKGKDLSSTGESWYNHIFCFMSFYLLLRKASIMCLIKYLLAFSGIKTKTRRSTTWSSGAPCVHPRIMAAFV
jgi:hypothetical protein